MTKAPYARVVETHSAVLFMLGERVYKFKKPVDLGFLDFRDIEKRRLACKREIDLNQRFSQDVYLGVGELTPPNGEVHEPAVVMRRMPENRRLSTLVANGADVTNELREIAKLLAGVHAGAVCTDHVLQRATAEFVASQWNAHLNELRAVAGDIVSSDVINRTEALALRYCEGRHQLFKERIERGWVCDGHGDLLADDIFCLSDGPRILDCLDFNDELRWGDVLSDIGFLVMDLERLGRPDLGAQLLACYDEFSGETHPPSLQDFYVAYRASVRSKVAAIRYAQSGDDAVRHEAQHLGGIALDHLELARVRLVLVGGLPGVGKSTVAEALGNERGWTVISSDVVRKEIVGLPSNADATAGWQEGIYVPETTSLMYCTMLERATHALRVGESVVLDASWTDVGVRELATRVAEEASADLIEIMCTTEPSVAYQRIGNRILGGANASDATAQIARRMEEEADAWPSAHRVDTTYSPSETMNWVRKLIAS